MVKCRNNDVRRSSVKKKKTTLTSSYYFDKFLNEEKVYKFRIFKSIMLRENKFVYYVNNILSDPLHIIIYNIL